MKSIDKILKRYWGYDSFRPLQREIIDSVTSKCDTIALMPTGGGKSLTYQVSALAMDGICIVITPLISLMKDQIDALRRRNIVAKMVHGGMTAREIDNILDNCVYGDYKFLYVSPERLETDIFRTRFQMMNVSMIAVDEAHCISQWGYDFRPAYLNIAAIRPLAPDAVVLAVTATATTLVVEDIKDKLDLDKPQLFRMSFARKNISYIVRDCSDKLAIITKICNSVAGCGIVYCNTRKKCEEVAQFLNGQQISSDYYHGALSYQMRAIKQEAWITDSTRIIVATNAFGMGIDKHDVRFVIHYDSPNTIEAYYQEAGRAGRDGESSYAVLLRDKSDENILTQRIESQYPSIADIKRIYSLICNFLSIAIGDGRDSAYEFNIFDFASKFRIFSTNVLNALNILQLCDYITLIDSFEQPTRIQIIVSREDLYRIQLLHRDLDGFITILMRLYTGLFSQLVAIDERYIAHASGYNATRIGELLIKLSRLHVIRYIPSRTTPLLRFNTERLSEDNIFIDTNQYLIRKDIALKRLDSIISYATQTEQCRSLIMQHYFGEESETECGKCDVCRAKAKRENEVNNSPQIDAIKEAILGACREKPLNLKFVKSRLPAPEEAIKIAVKELLDCGMIKLCRNGDITAV